MIPSRVKFYIYIDILQLYTLVASVLTLQTYAKHLKCQNKNLLDIKYFFCILK